MPPKKLKFLRSNEARSEEKMVSCLLQVQLPISCVASTSHNVSPSSGPNMRRRRRRLKQLLWHNVDNIFSKVVSFVENMFPSASTLAKLSQGGVCEELRRI